MLAWMLTVALMLCSRHHANSCPKMATVRFREQTDYFSLHSTSDRSDLTTSTFIWYQDLHASFKTKIIQSAFITSEWWMCINALKKLMLLKRYPINIDSPDNNNNPYSSGSSSNMVYPLTPLKTGLENKTNPPITLESYCLLIVMITRD